MSRVMKLLLALGLMACSEPARARPEASGYRSLTPDQFGILAGDRNALEDLTQIHVSPNGRLVYLESPAERFRGFSGALGKGAVVSITCFDPATSDCGIDRIDALQSLKFAGWSADSTRLYLIEKDALSELIVTGNATGQLVSPGATLPVAHELAFTYHATHPLGSDGLDAIADRWKRAWERIESSQSPARTIWETTTGPAGELIAVFEDRRSLQLTFDGSGKPIRGTAVATPWLNEGHLVRLDDRWGFASDGTLLEQVGDALSKRDVPWAARPIVDSTTGEWAGMFTPQHLHRLRVDKEITSEQVSVDEVIISAARVNQTDTLIALRDAGGLIRHCLHRTNELNCLKESKPSVAVETRAPVSEGHSLAFNILRRGAPSEKAVVFFMGGPASSAAYLPDNYLYSLFDAEGWDLILVEYSGSASYGPERASAFAHSPIALTRQDANEINAQLEQLGYSRLAAVGISFGAVPAIALGQTNAPVQCSILIVPYLQYRPAAEWTHLASGGGFAPSYQQKVDMATMGESAQGLTGFALELTELVKDWRPNGPVSVLFGEGDPVSLPTDLAPSIGAKITVVPGGHDLAMTDPQARILISETLAACVA